MSGNGKPPRILVFDSGVGGLSVAREISRRLPGVQLIYASDNAAFPYGTKTEQELVERVDQVLHQFLQLEPADIVVVACNTASTLALPRVRNRFELPIIGVVPAIKPAAALTRSGVIGLLATPGTVKRAYTHQLIADFASSCEVIMHGSAELVSLAEDKLRGRQITPELLAPVIAPLFTHPLGHKIDTIVLACTHFPLLKDELASVVPQPIVWVDSGEAIARRAEHWLQELGLLEAALTLAPTAGVALFSQATASVNELLPVLDNYTLISVKYT